MGSALGNVLGDGMDDPAAASAAKVLRAFPFG